MGFILFCFVLNLFVFGLLTNRQQKKQARKDKRGGV